MADSATVVLRDFITGAGRTGLTVTLRRITDNFAATYKTSTEVTGKPGVYEFLDVPFNKYKIWVNGSEDKSFGGDNGRWWPINNMLDYVFLYKDGGGHWDHQAGRIFGVADPVSGIDVGDRDYNDARYVLLSAYVNHLPPNTLLVSNTLDEIPGKVYETIQDAIDFAASQSPSNVNYWKIFVYAHTNTTSGYVENLTFQPGIHVIGLGRVRVTGTPSGFSQHVSITNIMFQSSGNMTFNNNAFFENCYARLTGAGTVAITIDTIRGDIFLMPTHVNHSITSNGNNVIVCRTNKEFAVQESDAIHAIFLPGITDFDTAGDPS